MKKSITQQAEPILPSTWMTRVPTKITILAMHKRIALILFLTATVAPGESRVQPLVGTRGMVVSDDREASEWGAEILRAGGNAIDAAVATAFMLSVTRPHFASLGGGGFLLYCPHPESGHAVPCHAIDYREEAPSAAARDMYVRNGKADPDLSRNGALAIGTPGVVAGLLTALEKYGTMPRAKLLSRPIEKAKKGYRFTAYSENAAKERWAAMNPEARKIFGCHGVPCAPGTLIRQLDAARVLSEISKKGKDAFYRGWAARKIVAGIRAAGGILTGKDLIHYQAKFRDPLVGFDEGMQVISMPPPSGGGVVLLQMLGFTQLADQEGEFREGFDSVPMIHALAHGMALAFADRAKYLGDADQVPVPIQSLLSKKYLAMRWKTFREGRVTPVEAGSASRLGMIESQFTTNFCVIDREGNAVDITTTVNDDFGSGFVPPGTGIVMNDEMDDFSAQPGVPNLFGLVGSKANAIAPYKRPLSSMTPTIVRDSAGNARIAIGAAGGPRITTSVFLSLVGHLRFGLSLPDAVAAPRFHEQWKPARLMLERFGFAPETLKALRQMGYVLDEVPNIARVYGIERVPHDRGFRTLAAPDPRGEGGGAAE